MALDVASDPTEEIYIIELDVCLYGKNIMWYFIH